MSKQSLDRFIDVEQLRQNIETAKQEVEGFHAEVKARLESLSKLSGEILRTTSVSGGANNRGAAEKEIASLKELIAEREKLLKRLAESQAIFQKDEEEGLRRRIIIQKELDAQNKEAAKNYDRLLKERQAAEAKARKDKESADEEARKRSIANSKAERDELLSIQKELDKRKKEQQAADEAARKRDIANSKAERNELLAVQRELDKRQKEQQAAMKREEKATAELANADLQLTKQIRDMEAAYKQSYLTLGQHSKITIGLRDEVNALKKVQNDMNTSIGNYRANVGNYSSAWNGLGVSIRQVARELPNFGQSMQLGILAISNNLPILADELALARTRIAALKAEGKDVPSLFTQVSKSILSWQTGLTIGITLLVAYADKIGEFANKLKEQIFPVSMAEKAMKLYQETLGKSGEVESAIANVEMVTQMFELSRQGVVSKKEAVDEYNKTLGTTLGQTDSWAEAEKNLIEKAPAFIQMTQLKATAMEAYSRSAKAQIEILQKLQKDGGREAVELFLNEGLISTEKVSQDLKNAYETFSDMKSIGDEALASAAKLADKVKLNISGGKAGAGKAEMDWTNELLGARKKAIDEQRKLDLQRLEDQIAIEADIFQNEKNSYEKRIVALDRWSKLKEKYNNISAEGELSSVKESLSEIEKIEGIAVEKRTNEQKKLLLYKNALLTEEKRLSEKAATDNINLDLETEKERLKIVKDLSEQQLAVIMGRMKEIELIGRKAKMSDNDILQNQINYLQQALKAMGLSDDDIQKIKSQIRKLQIAQKDAEDQDEARATQKMRRFKRERNRYLEQMGQEAARLMADLLNAQIEAEVRALEKRKEMISEEYDSKRAAVDAAFANEKEKSERKTMLALEEKQAQDRIDQEIRKQRRKQAELEKLQALASIAINTARALADAKNLALLGALSPFILGLAAVQVAAVVATPIPEYATGKKEGDNYEGPAIAGEAGTEVWKKRDGSIEVLTKPSLIQTKAGDRIYSNKELREMADKSRRDTLDTQVFHDMIRNSVHQTNREISVLRENTEMLIDAIYATSADNALILASKHARA